MIGYVVSWLIYLASVFALLAVYYYSLARFLPESWRPVVLMLAASILLTPWPIDSQTWLPAPAIIATLFNVLSGEVMDGLKTLLPILFVVMVSSFVMWFKQRRHTTAY
ncbi:MAG: hypothetical protein IPI79_11195 [Moraxellaceae bacterium]|jgi:hypothetical protein|nr:hypothetical protein [Moraxellaceae bacterium]HQV79988.1 hypothetical protein [Agitococcus sp.]MBK7300841.1 hypothetical protein [Moraxellaceae bacterium]MBK8327671.1 hypothetical protein [Moraxellaceae bacterium]MBK9185545.1 hypothetical protein [Moraxellaceae bacterium]